MESHAVGLHRAVAHQCPSRPYSSLRIGPYSAGNGHPGLSGGESETVWGDPSGLTTEWSRRASVLGDRVSAARGSFAPLGIPVGGSFSRGNDDERNIGAIGLGATDPAC